MSVRTRYHVALAALFALALSGCAAGGGAPDSPPPLERRAYVSPIRDNMRPEHRVFYDMLEGLGDWTLVEPYGYVFRPDVNFVAWRPYVNGYWVASDPWGWVWVSGDDFGWATDHYGRWIHDRFQGWIWVPGTSWGPAWVAWAGDDDVVGWAPLSLGGAAYDGGEYVFVPARALASTDVATRLLPATALSTHVSRIKPITREVEVGGARLPAGPAFDWVERHTGPLRRTRIADMAPPGAPTRGRVQASAPHAATRPAAADSVRAERESRAEAQHAAERAAEETRARAQAGSAAPEQVPVMRPFESAPRGREERPARDERPAREERPARPAPSHPAADADSTR